MMPRHSCASAEKIAASISAYKMMFRPVSARYGILVSIVMYCGWSVPLGNDLSMSIHHPYAAHLSTHVLSQDGPGQFSATEPQSPPGSCMLAPIPGDV